MPRIINPAEMAAVGLRPFRADLSVYDGDADYNTPTKVAAKIEAIAVGDEGLIWQRKIGAQQFQQWGYGVSQLPDNQGYMQFAAVDAGTDHDVGTIRLMVDGANGVSREVIASYSTSRLHGTSNTSAAGALSNNRLEQQAFPARPMGVGQDDVMQIWYRREVDAGTVDDVAFAIPTTIWQ